MRRQKPVTNHGFTIVELLVVIVVIGILAAIAIISFNGIRSQAVVSSLQSDLVQNQKKLAVYAAQNSDQFPLNQPDAVTYGIKSTSNTLSYRWINGNNYCLSVTNSSLSSTYYITNVITTPTAGACPVVVNSFVGTIGASGYVDATGTNARFSGTSGLAFDSSGNLYIAEIAAHRIRRVTPAGVVTTYAGTGVAGFTNGSVASAQLNGPFGLAFDSVGNLFVAERGNNAIRRITPGGVVSTLAGTGVAGFRDGAGTVAQFNGMDGIAIDSSDNIYGADGLNNRIRRITPSGVVSTFAGSGVSGSQNGTGTSARIVPLGIAIDSSNTLYVTTVGGIRKISPSAVVTTLVDLGGEVEQPRAIDVDATGTVYVGDVNRFKVYKVSPAGVVTVLAGDGIQLFVNGLATASSFASLGDIALNQSGIIFVSEGNYVASLIQ